MKNKLLSFIDLLIFFFNQGYSLQETLDFCSLLNYEKEVKEIKNYLNQGLSLDEIFIMLPFPTLFKEYYSSRSILHYRRAFGAGKRSSY